MYNDNVLKEKEKKLLNNVIKLPDVLIDVIYHYIPLNTVVFFNKVNYIKHHYIIKHFIAKNSYESYIRDIIRRDNWFVFKQIWREKWEHWTTLKRYEYKNIIFYNYIFFLVDYCIENESNNCREYINDKIKELGLSKNLHKKNHNINVRWRT